MLFTYADASTGREIWKSDGTEAGTGIFQDLTPGTDGTLMSNIIVNGDSILFDRADSQYTSWSLWRSDGSNAGTASLTTVSFIQPASSSPALMTTFGTNAYFSATDNTHGTELWMSDGTAQGTMLLKDMVPGTGSADPSNVIVAHQRVFLLANDLTGRKVWSSDGTPAGTTALTATSGPAYNGASKLTLSSDALFFVTTTTQNVSLWRIDSATTTLQLVKTIGVSSPGKTTPQVRSLTAANGKVFFVVTSLGIGMDQQLWTSDGTADGTTLVKQIRNITALTVFRNMLVFSRVSDDGCQLWKSDGTDAGTIVVARLGDTMWNCPTAYTAWNDQLYFAATTVANGQEVWHSDGTSAGTALVRDIAPGSASAAPADFTVIDDRVFFSAWDAVHGRELWQTDGTFAGTVLVKDVCLGACSSSPSSLTRIADQLLFAASSGVSNNELWVGDGTDSQTRRIQQITAMPAGAIPSAFGVARSTVLFSADDAEHGNELWAVDLGSLYPPPTARDSTISISAPAPGQSITGTLAVDAPKRATLTFRIVTNGMKGTASLLPATTIQGMNTTTTAQFSYTPFPNTYGEDPFTFRLDKRNTSSCNYRSMWRSMNSVMCSDTTQKLLVRRCNSGTY